MRKTRIPCTALDGGCGDLARYRFKAHGEPDLTTCEEHAFLGYQAIRSKIPRSVQLIHQDDPQPTLFD